MGESRAYRLRASEPLPEAIARVARGRIDHAIDELRGKTASTPVEAVHEARKDMKKLRALLRLARGELGGRVYARENACFRDAARELAGQRDADVMLETLGSLPYLPAGEAWEVRKRIQADLARNGDEGGREAAVRGAVEILEEARGRVGDWPLERDAFDDSFPLNEHPTSSLVDHDLSHGWIDEEILDRFQEWQDAIETAHRAPRAT